MPRRKGKTMEMRAKARARRHGIKCKPPSKRGRRGLRKRWLVHQLAGMDGYKNTDLP